MRDSNQIPIIFCLILGTGSLLSPSGDEDCISDQESLLSPLSHSSIGSSREDMGLLEEDTVSSSPPPTDDDYIEPDFPPSASNSPNIAVHQALAIPVGKNQKQPKKKVRERQRQRQREGDRYGYSTGSDYIIFMLSH